MDSERQPKIGIAIAAFNGEEIIEDCLRELLGLDATIVLFDDNSSDETVLRARRVWPTIKILNGDGDSWWAGGTRRAIEACLAEGCDHIVMLNPDVRLSAESTRTLVSFAQQHPRTIAAALVVQDHNDEIVAWAGSRHFRLPFLPIHTGKYTARPGRHVSLLPQHPFFSDEAHGRGVVLTAQVIEEIGLLDDVTFPHYGADNDYSYRATRAGIEMYIHPGACARLLVENTGMKVMSWRNPRKKLGSIWNYLLRRKSGDALRVTWRLYRRHLPHYAVVPSFVFAISLNVARRLF